METLGSGALWSGFSGLYIANAGYSQLDVAVGEGQDAGVTRGGLSGATGSNWLHTCILNRGII